MIFQFLWPFNYEWPKILLIFDDLVIELEFREEYSDIDIKKFFPFISIHNQFQANRYQIP